MFHLRQRETAAFFLLVINMELYYVMYYYEGRHFNDLDELNKRLDEIHAVETSGRLFNDYDLAMGHASSWAIEQNASCVLFKLDLKMATQILPIIKVEKKSLI